MDTARSIISGVSTIGSVALQQNLGSLALAYLEVINDPKFEDFYGLRDFYNLVKFLQRRLTVSTDTFGSLLLEGVLRNFGGTSTKTVSSVVKSFFEKASLQPTQHVLSIPTLIDHNMKDPFSRHLMLLSSNATALEILLQEGLISHKNTIVLFGSDFPLDNTDAHICHNILKIKNCMELGHRIVLINTENLYESLYGKVNSIWTHFADMLNQNYTQRDTRFFCNVAMGDNRSKCIVHPDCKIIVIADMQKRIPPPLLNRFEKQQLSYETMLTPPQRDLLQAINSWIEDFVNLGNVNYKVFFAE
jgi:hypothetical protein